MTDIRVQNFRGGFEKGDNKSSAETLQAKPSYSPIATSATMQRDNYERLNDISPSRGTLEQRIQLKHAALASSKLNSLYHTTKSNLLANANTVY